MKILGKNLVMIDLETLSSKPDAAILSIGAVKFRFDTGIYDEFYINVDPADCKRLGMRVERETVEWWAKQSKEALQAFKSPAPVPLGTALTMFSEWWNKDQMIKHPISHGAAFDIPILEIAYTNTGGVTPWKYPDVLCNRTIFSMLEIDNRSIRSKEDSVYHNALDDAKSQANTLIKVFQ